MGKTSFERLMEFGDLLDATDEVREFNDIGFNKADKSGWQMVRGKETAMKIMLFKYREQLRSRCGDAVVDEVDWTLPENHKDILKGVKDEFKSEREARRQAEKEELRKKQVAENVATVNFEVLDHGYGATIRSARRLEGERWTIWDRTNRALGRNLGPAKNFMWQLPFNFDYTAYKTALEAFGIVVSELPPVDPAKIAASANMASWLANDVRISKRIDGTLAIDHKFCPKMNQAYHDAEETSGILGFDWSTKSRLVGANQIDDLDEVLAAFTKFQPSWKIAYNFDIAALRADHAAAKAARRVLTDALVRHMKPELRPLPYQAEGYFYYEQFDGCALNGDDMGLGKTLQTLLFAANRTEAGAAHHLRTLVVCPKNVRRQWLQEADKFFLPGTFTGYEIDSKKTPKDINLGQYDLVTINYENLDKFKEAILAAGFDLIVIDESHRIKNPKAKITQLVLSMGPSFKYRICLSGTPIKNKKREIYTQANFIRPGIFQSEAEVINGTFFGVREKMKTFFFRRTKKQELKDLPPKLRQVTPLFCGKMPDYKKGMEIGEISALKSALANAKVPYTIEELDDMLENTDSKIIVFSDSDDAAQAIAAHYGDLAVLHVGATPHEKRELAKAAFCDENSPIRLFVATTGSSREGLNLTVADKVVFNDLPWTPADLNQAEDRAWRLGQKYAVNVYWMSVEGNEFDRRAILILSIKAEIYNKVINGKKPTKAEEAFLKASMESLMKKKDISLENFEE